MAQYAQKCPGLSHRGHSDACILCAGQGMYTGNGSAARGGMNRGMALMDLHLPLNPEDLTGFHIIEGATGNDKGRPKKAFEELSRTGKIKRLQAEAREDYPKYLYGYEPSTPKDWDRERKERRKAVGWCQFYGLALGPNAQV